MGVKGDGKTTVATAIMHKLDQTTVIIDVARQFDANEYRIVTNMISELKYHLLNPIWSEAFRNGRMQIVFRPNDRDIKREVEKACDVLKKVPNILIYFEEMELYADGYLNKNSSIFNIVYLMRNRGHTIIVVAKQAAKLSGLIKDMFDYFFLGSLESERSLAFFKDLGGKDLVSKIKATKLREFLVVGRRGYTQRFKLDHGIARLLK
jgi:hypothetical protein